MTEKPTNSTAAQVERMLRRRGVEAPAPDRPTPGLSQSTIQQMAAINARRVANIADEDAYREARASLTPRERSLARRMREADEEDE
ncbi:hypothetical protein [Rathayibacter sp. AY1H2]|uniref:hypothetical protein n=1 Tax=Rathayibacter sp. AY1H2 TaxID=2080566 RepID=UPI000CE7A6B0|nr:hypothetical protein [Rathayibacter sp. AY1H2]PPG85485.1 hypothetical protein C5C29_06010 [Rathayibacter sp. AY1H2]